MKYVKVVKPGNNQNLLARTYNQIEKEMMVVPPLAV